MEFDAGGRGQNCIAVMATNSIEKKSGHNSLVVIKIPDTDVGGDVTLRSR